MRHYGEQPGRGNFISCNCDAPWRVIPDSLFDDNALRSARSEMPIPPAHPLAVIPLRRWCPKHLSFPALVIGSLTPDMANCLSWDYFTHSLLGSFAFCLPFGTLLLVLFAMSRASLAAALPSPHREALLPLCTEWKSSKAVCLLSLLLGTWTHLTWDLVTHNHSEVAQSLGYWTLPLPGGPKEIRASTILGILSGLLGSTGVAVTYWRWLRKRKPSAQASSARWQDVLPRWLPWIALPLMLSIPLGMIVTKNQGGLLWIIRAIVEFYLPLQCFSLAVAGAIFGRRRDRSKRA